ncbi:MAG TPA: uroporphyrinogen decarboxylase [Myxococcota bacterium]|nr:uroporphyrinogen decarboxylase [Myxococcota bacterium]
MSRADRFLRACRGEPVDTTPVWIMRQAGRYLPEYRATRARAGSFLALCKAPELAAEVTLQPIRRLAVDAAIIFSDILVVSEAMGLRVDYPEGGPRLTPAVRDRRAIDALRSFDGLRDCGFVMDAIALVRQRLDGEVPLIGFAGAPFTLACYMAEGETSRDYLEIKRLMFTAPDDAHVLLGRIAEGTIAYLDAQAAAGVQAIQLFDTWADTLSPRDLREFCLPYAARVVSGVRARLAARGAAAPPIIYFARGTAGTLELLPGVGADVLGLDWRVDLGDARRRIGATRPVQGNLDPAAMLLPAAALERRVAEILDAAGPQPGHVFNLGHGILPPTDPESAVQLVELVHRLGRGRTAGGPVDQAGA